MSRTRIGILASGSGTNVRALCEAAAQPDAGYEVAIVVSNRADSGALDIARGFGVGAQVVALRDYADTGARDRAMAEVLNAHSVALVVCAGYNRILSDEFLAAFPDAVINVHPSLLPAFAGGMNAVADALAAGVKVTGCTVHFLEPGAVDGGPIIAQATVEIAGEDTADTLLAKVHTKEWQLLPHAVELWCRGRLRRVGNRVDVVTEEALPL